jgi:hypothetical protein
MVTWKQRPFLRNHEKLNYAKILSEVKLFNKTQDQINLNKVELEKTKKSLRP